MPLLSVVVTALGNTEVKSSLFGCFCFVWANNAEKCRPVRESEEFNTIIHMGPTVDNKQGLISCIKPSLLCSYSSSVLGGGAVSEECVFECVRVCVCEVCACGGQKKYCCNENLCNLFHYLEPCRTPRRRRRMKRRCLSLQGFPVFPSWGLKPFTYL